MSVESSASSESSENPHDFSTAPSSHSSTSGSEEHAAYPQPAERPSTGRIWFFVLLRLLFFLVPLALLWVLTGEPWFSAIAAALIGFALSLLLLQRQRDPLLQIVYQRTSGQLPSTERGDDEHYEDEVVDNLETAPGNRNTTNEASETMKTGSGSDEDRDSEKLTD